MVWTYNINQDAWWHDSTKVTAEDVNFTFNLVLDNEDECALFGDYLKNVTEVVALDDYTVRITTEVPKATMLSIMVPILPKHIWELIPTDQIDSCDYWRDTDLFPDGPVGSGPLVLSEYVKDDYIKMLAWPEYYIDTVNFDELIYKVFTDDDSMMNALDSGELDVATGVPTGAWEDTLSTPNVDGQAVKALSLFELGMNCMPEILRENFNQASDNLEMLNLSVRQAIAMCVNRTYIVDVILSGLADPGSSLIPTATDQWHYDVPASEEFEFDLEAAKALLDAAGYRDENENGIRENVSNEVELDLIFYYRSDVTVADQLAAEEISLRLLEVGINAPAQGIQESTLYTYWYQARYDLYIWAWDTDVDPSFMLSVMTTDQIPDDPTDWTKWSDCFYANPYYDQLFIDQQNAIDFEERQAIIFEMQQILYRDCPYVVLWYPFGLYAYRTDTFYNYPDMVANPGMTPGSMWFFFEVLPVGTNTPPHDVSAGADQTTVVDKTLSFTGSADDIESPQELTYEWTFVEPDSSEFTRTGQTVSYLFENVGTVEVTLNVTDVEGLSATDEITVTVEAAPDVFGWLAGYVNDSAEQAVTGATVTAGTYSMSTDAEGYYNFTLAPGTYTVNASKTGFLPQEEDAAVVDQMVTWQNFTLTPTAGSVEGHVYDATTSAPISGASVKVVDTTNLALTNATGYYSFSGLESGTYELNVSITGYDAVQVSFEISAGETTVKDVNLQQEDTGDTGGGGLGTLALATLGIIGAIIVAAVVLMVIKKRKSSEPPPPDVPPQ
jgi:peptide/nickel transport system substrate-binding protein